MKINNFQAVWLYFLIFSFLLPEPHNPNCRSVCSANFNFQAIWLWKNIPAAWERCGPVRI